MLKFDEFSSYNTIHAEVENIAWFETYSIIESAKENGLNPFPYLSYLFEQLPNGYGENSSKLSEKELSKVYGNEQEIAAGQEKPRNRDLDR